MFSLSALLLSSSLWSGLAEAKDCPSKLPSHTKEITDTLEMGVELRTIGVALAPGEGTAIPEAIDPDASVDVSLMAGLRFLTYYYPTDFLTFTFEPEMRGKMPGWDEENIQGFWPMRLNQAMVELETGDVESALGIQTIAWGTNALLDIRGMGAKSGYSNSHVAVEGFAAMTQKPMLRNGPSCLWERYTLGRYEWKDISSTMSDNRIVGGTISYKDLKPWKLKALYFYSDTTADDTDGHFFSANITGPLIKKRLSLMVEPVLTLNSDGDIKAGSIGMFRMSLFDGKHAPRGRIGFATNFTEDPVASIWENLSWGYLRRYSLHDENLATMRIQIPFHDNVRAQLNYNAASSSFADGVDSDELNAGFLFDWSSLITVNLSAVALDVVGDPEPSLGGYLEMRLIGGS